MLQLVPSDIELFNAFILRTDDHLLSMRQHTVYPKDADGTPDYGSNDKKEITEPVWQYLEWSQEQMSRWSAFRQRNNELYASFKTAEGEEKRSFETLLNENIAACIAFDHELGISKNFPFAHTYGVDREIFGFQQDKLQFQTPLRTITLNYEKQIPLSDFEKQFIEKYIEMHRQTPGITHKLIGDIKQLHSRLPALWEKIYVAKDKSDLTTNTIYMPPPEMKGDFSPMVKYYVPSAEEQQQRTDDFNQYIKDFVAEINGINAQSDILCDLVYGKENDCHFEFPLQDEVDDMYNELIHNWSKYSLDASAVDDDFQEYWGEFDKEQKHILPTWEAYIDELNLIVELYDKLVENFRIKFHQDGTDEEDEEVFNEPTDDEEEKKDKPNDIPIWETDDLRQETIHRYESEMGSPFFDVDDWHIIMDHFSQKYDEKNKAIALEKALSQHPENATLLLRKAQEEIGKHEYQKASELVKRAEAQGPPHHPNLFFIKADIYCQMHAPEKAILVLNKLIAAEGPEELEMFRERARFRLLDIYEEQKNYNECIRVMKVLLEKAPDDESLNADICRFYRLNGMLKEAEETSNAFLMKDPKSALSIEQLGHLYFDQKEFKKAAEQFEMSYALNKSEHYHDLFYAGNAYLELKRYDEAVLCYETSLFHFHLDKELHLAAAQCYAALNMPYAADFHYKKTLDLDPENTKALEKLNLMGN